MFKFLQQFILFLNRPEKPLAEESNPDKDRYDQAIKLLLFEGICFEKL
jgi:hypothetical protein